MDFDLTESDGIHRFQHHAGLPRLKLRRTSCSYYALVILFTCHSAFCCSKDVSGVRKYSRRRNGRDVSTRLKVRSA